jgi:hypothetical protein
MKICKICGSEVKGRSDGHDDFIDECTMCGTKENYVDIPDAEIEEFDRIMEEASLEQALSRYEQGLEVG